MIRDLNRRMRKLETASSLSAFTGFRIFEYREDFEAWLATEQGQQQGERPDPIAPFTGLTVIGPSRMKIAAVEPVAGVAAIPPQYRARG